MWLDPAEKCSYHSPADKVPVTNYYLREEEIYGKIKTNIFPMC